MTAADVTHAQLEEVFEDLKEKARPIIESGQEHMPMLLFYENLDGKLELGHVQAVRMRNEADKAKVARLINAALSQWKVCDAVILVCESWTLKLPKGIGLREARALAESLAGRGFEYHPDRCAALMTNFYTRGQQFTVQNKITGTGKDRRVTFGTLPCRENSMLAN